MTCAHSQLCPPGVEGLPMASSSGHLAQSHQLSDSGCSATGTHFLPCVSTSWYICVSVACIIHGTKKLRLWILNSPGTIISQISRVSNDSSTLQPDLSFLPPMHLQSPSPWSSHFSSGQLSSSSPGLPFPGLLQHLHSAPLSICLYPLASCALIAFCF